MEEKKTDSVEVQTRKSLYGKGKYNSFAMKAAVRNEESPPQSGMTITLEHNNKETDPDVNEEDARTPAHNIVMMSPIMNTSKSKTNRTTKSYFRGGSPM